MKSIVRAPKKRTSKKGRYATSAPELHSTDGRWPSDWKLSDDAPLCARVVFMNGRRTNRNPCEDRITWIRSCGCHFGSGSVLDFAAEKLWLCDDDFLEEVRERGDIFYVGTSRPVCAGISVEGLESDLEALRVCLADDKEAQRWLRLDTRGTNTVRCIAAVDDALYLLELTCPPQADTTDALTTTV